MTDFKPLDDLVDRMRDETGYVNEIPRFSNNDGGTNARCLFLFETPNQVAVDRGYAETENQDPAARNVEEARSDAGLERTLTISWNIVPWQHPDPPGPVVREALPWLGELLKLLPELRVVMLCGGNAQVATSYLYRNYPDLCVLHAPHPARRGLSSTERREHFWAAMKKAASKV